VITLRKYPSM